MIRIVEISVRFGISSFFRGAAGVDILGAQKKAALSALEPECVLGVKARNRVVSRCGLPRAISACVEALLASAWLSLADAGFEQGSAKMEML
jgi:hypothetical protein